MKLCTITPQLILGWNSFSWNGGKLDSSLPHNTPFNVRAFPLLIELIPYHNLYNVGLFHYCSYYAHTPFQCVILILGVGTEFYCTTTWLIQPHFPAHVFITFSN